MIQLTSANGEVAYGVNEYIIDTDTELANIPKSAEAGSTAYSVSSGSTFIKGNDGNWSVKNAGASSGDGDQGGSTIIELPDNLLYSYEMSEEEFWNEYSNGTLIDSLYGYNEEGLYYPVNTKELQPTPIPELSLVYNNTCWAVSYTRDSLLEIDETGVVKNTYKFKDCLNTDLDMIMQNTYVKSQQALCIDNNGFLYLNCDSRGYKDYNSSEWDAFVVSANLNNINNINSWKTCGDKAWVFSTLAYSPNNQYIQECSLKSSSGIFALSYGGRSNTGGDIAYFENGEITAVLGYIDTITGSMGADIDNQCAAVDYNNNILYYLRPCASQYWGSMTHTELWWFDPKDPQAYNCIKFPEIFVDALSPQTTRMLFDNNIIYISWISKNSHNLRYVLYDISQSLIIQNETIDLMPKLGSYPLLIATNYFSIYKYESHIYAPILIPIYSGDEYSPLTDISILRIIDIDTEHYAIDYWDIDYEFKEHSEQRPFKDSCINNYFLMEKNNKIIIYDLKTRQPVVETKELYEHYINWLNNISTEDFFIISYSLDYHSQFEVLKINPITGNVVSIKQNTPNDSWIGVSYNQENLVFLKDINKILFQGRYILNKETMQLEKELATQYYYYSNRYFFAEINNKLLYTTNAQNNTSYGGYYTYNPEAKKQYSILLHNNEAIINTFKYNIPEEGVNI